MITVLAPYGRNEVTAAAIRLADFGVSLGHEVNLVAAGTYERHVHPAWDSKVKNGNKRGIYKAAAKADHVVHFQCHKSWYDSTSLVTERSSGRAQHILVPNWHGLTGCEMSLMRKYDRIICPSKACKRVIHTDVFEGDKGVTKEKLLWVRWDVGVDKIRCEGTVESGHLRACIVCDTSTIDMCGPMVLQLIDELLTTTARLQLTILSTKSWSRDDRRRLESLKTKWESSLIVRKIHEVQDTEHEIRAHDWVVIPSVRSDFSITASRALACGKPVIVHDIEPFNEIVTASSGFLVPCDVRYGILKSPIAIPQFANWLETCRKALGDTKPLFSLQTNNWSLDEYQTAFKNVWGKVLS